jgi:uncharacterized NAD(P)/FAD-binding protein YdhS
VALLRTIGIVGGGFCGAVLAANLLRKPPSGPTRLVLIERDGAVGRGVAVIDADGWPSPHLFYVGPMLRADLWEATAASELRGHAERLAALLATQRD